jgi:hypothetical protein
MSKIKRQDFEKYDKLFYEFIKFLVDKNKDVDIKEIFHDLNVKDYDDYFFNEVSLEEDGDYEHFYIADYINKYRISFLEYTKKFQIIYSSNFYSPNKRFTSVELVFDEDSFKLNIENRQKEGIHIKRNNVMSYNLAFADLNNFDKLWKKILDQIKDELEKWV